MYQFKKMIKVLLLCLLTACNGNDKEYSVISPEQEIEAGGSSDYTELLNKTRPVPAEYNQESVLKGNVVQIDYNTKNYVEGTGEVRKNTAYVYLPYGYDEASEQPYNVFYFVHGHGETAISFSKMRMVCCANCLTTCWKIEIWLQLSSFQRATFTELLLITILTQILIARLCHKNL